MADNPLAFYNPDRFTAEILWMREVHVQYHFPKVGIRESDLEYLEFVV